MLRNPPIAKPETIKGKLKKNNDNGKFAAKRQKRKKLTAHSGTFGCPSERATASQLKEPSFCLRTQAHPPPLIAR
ncbi:MAG TPA: hypothetical protein DCX03_02105 [Bacteroidales bacterium]|nr:hypothetical protein [Bacteroidales bacterium]